MFFKDNEIKPKAEQAIVTLLELNETLTSVGLIGMVHF